MKPPLNWDRIQEIYHAASGLPDDQRSAFVTKECAGNEDCVREVLSLIGANTVAGILENPPVFKINPTDELVGKTIGERYFVERELGGGGMSQVYRALDRRLGDQPVVIKVLSPSLVQDRDARRRFDQEVAALRQSDHPGVVRVLDRGDLRDGKPYIVMKYVDGETLRSRIENQGMDLERVQAIVKQVTDALEHVHEQGIFHRDLKPENILLKTGSDNVVIIDFGIAKVQNLETTATGTSVGTLNYMSPEQLRGERVTAASDIYSMAVVVYEMVTGRRPFNPSSTADLLELQRAGVRVRPRHLRPELPHQAERTILRALSFDPKSRYQNVRAFGDKLAQELVEPLRTEPVNFRRWAKVASALIILSVLSFGIYTYIKKKVVNHSFTYWIMVQPVGDQTPTKSNGEEVFKNGDKFQLNVETPNSAYFYVFYEGSQAPGDTNFRMIFPNPATNNGSAALGPNQPLQFDWMTFPGTAGTENFWLVWSLTQVSQLESAKTEAFKHPRGGLNDPTLTAVKEFFRTHPPTSTWHYKATQNAMPRGKGEILVALAQFKHQ
jgi:serine/threonine protein kinase